MTPKTKFEAEMLMNMWKKNAAMWHQKAEQLQIELAKEQVKNFELELDIAEYRKKFCWKYAGRN